MLEKLKKEVYEANMDLVRQNLVIYTWGNVSAYDKASGYVVIKPSGVKYETMKIEDMVVVDLEGNVVEGELKPSSDTMTHLEIYKHFKGVHAVVHTHSKWATIFAQSAQGIPPLGTTHADYFNQEVPITRPMTDKEVANDYEKNTGRVIVETFNQKNINPLHCPGILVHEHGPFTWGKDAKDAVHNAVVLDTIAEMAHRTIALKGSFQAMNQNLLKKHFTRKHGKNSYYGQD